MEDVKVVRFGLGEVVSNFGTFGGHPAVFIEPVEPIGPVGSPGPDMAKDSVVSGGLILQFLKEDGADILIEDILSALGRSNGSAHNLPKDVPGPQAIAPPR